MDQWSHWSMVIIPDDATAKFSGSGMVNQITIKYQAANLPEGVEVYAGKTTSGDHIFVFSPKVSEIAADVLSTFLASPYGGEPPLSALRRVKV